MDDVSTAADHPATASPDDVAEAASGEPTSESSSAPTGAAAADPAADVLPLHPGLESALGAPATWPAAWTVSTLTAALGTVDARVTAPLAAAVAALDVDRAAAVPGARLLAAASREAELQGDIRVHGEYLLLGILRALGDPAALLSGRDAFQELQRDRAIDAYRRVPLLPRAPAAPRPRVVLVAGLPGAGKSTLAEGLARALHAPVYSLDWQLGALLPFGALRDDNAGPLSEVALIASVARQLQLGLPAIVDTTAASTGERDRLRSVVEALDADLVGIECVCSDVDLHQTRVAGRSRGIPGWHPTVPWEHVERMRGRWQEWPERDLVVDSAELDVEGALRQALAVVSAA